MAKIGTKCCSRCKVEKPFDEFHNRKESSDGRRADCKECYSKRQARRHLIVKDEVNAKRRTPEGRIKNKEYAKLWRSRNPKPLKESKKTIQTEAERKERQRVQSKIYRQNPEVKKRRAETSKVWIENNPERVKIRRAETRLKNAEKQNKQARERYARNKVALFEWKKTWREKNPDKVKEADKRRNNVIKNNPLLKMGLRIRTQVNSALKKFGYAKNSHTSVLLGISYELFKIHIERQFKKGMNWENHGNGDDKWHLDHIRPLASAKTESELLLLFHYTNLRPLWSKENMSKGAKIIEHQLKIAI